MANLAQQVEQVVRQSTLATIKLIRANIDASLGALSIDLGGTEAKATATATAAGTAKPKRTRTRKASASTNGSGAKHKGRATSRGTLELAAKIAEFLGQSPGVRAGEIAKGLDTKPILLTGAFKAGLDRNWIKKEGYKAQTMYYLGATPAIVPPPEPTIPATPTNASEGGGAGVTTDKAGNVVYPS